MHKSPKQINCQCSNVKSSCSSAIYQDSLRCSGCIRIPYIGCSSCSSSRQPFRFLSFSLQRYHPTRNVAGWLHKQVALTGIVLQSSLSPDPAGTPRLAGLLHKHTLIFCFVNFNRSSRRNFPVKHHRELHICPCFPMQQQHRESSVLLLSGSFLCYMTKVRLEDSKQAKLSHRRFKATYS